MKKVSRKWIWIIIIIALVIFFFPKECGNWGTAIHPDAKYKDCTCVGIKYSPPLVGGAYITCFGVPASYSCYYYQGNAAEGNYTVEKIEIPC